ncbi:sensor domain-containing diguanylate cyclase [Deefgea piscis]|uniref:Sensor protein FixL n=1 Tax=Deefgea piscis TaxID=2739061 RepID=A0A6M8SNN9_9NEIS|nr:diguanylate cyclase [Deefgea piscis]QKJ65804.1 sensor domain-containing diguanylate cyclase [Deefgea piscis]
MALNQLKPDDFDFFREFLDALPLQCFVKNAHGQIILSNTAYQNASAEAVVPLKVIELGENETCRQLVSLTPFAQANEKIATHEETRWNSQLGRYQTDYVIQKTIADEAGQPLYIVGSILDISEQKQFQLQIDTELKLLEMHAADVPFMQLLTQFVHSFESNFPGVLCSILLLDDQGERLLHTIAPSLPEAYCQAIHGVAIGPNIGSCGTAAYTGQDTIVADIASDPLWRNFAELALSHDLRSCWSIPILSTKGRVLGTFANYHRYPCSPSSKELQAIKRGAYLVGLVIEHELAETQLSKDKMILQESVQHTQTILDNMADGVITIDITGRIESFNSAASRIFGYSPEEVLFKNVSMLMPEPHAGLHDGYLLHHQSTGNASIVGVPREVEGLRKDGSLFPMRLSVSKILRAGQPIFIGLVSDNTLDHQRREEIYRLAFFDALTGLPNRRLLMDQIKKAMLTSARSGLHGAVMFLDLDHFKHLNDNYGHHMGDLLLQQVSARLQSCVRENDSVARLGGDEFVVLLETLSEQAEQAFEQAKTVANKILERLRQPYDLSGHTHVSTPSIGVALFLAEQISIDDLLKHADVAMYQAKAAGRNTVLFYNSALQGVTQAH